MTSDQGHRTKDSVREITVILVSWNDEADLRACVSSLGEARRRIGAHGPRVSLQIVDNGGSVHDRLTLTALWPEACLLVNSVNRGYGPAANQAAEQASGDVLLFVNPDTLAEGDLFSEIAAAFDANPAASAVAPRLLDYADNTLEESKIQNPKSKILRPLLPPDREDQFTFQLRRLPTLGSDARELLLVDHLAPNNPARRRSRYADAGREFSFEVEQAAAAALAVRSGVFRAVAGFDERFVPAWFEDVDLCARLRHEGPILYWPGATLRHRGGGSAHVMGYARFLPVYYGNALRYRRLHYGAPARLLYRPLLAAGMLLRLAALLLRPRVPRPRAESARAYLATLGVALGLVSPKSKIQNPKSYG